MKKQILLCFVLTILLGATQLSAQKPFAGTITYELSAENTDDANIISQFAGQTKDVIILNNCTKTLADMQGISIIAISNGDYKSGYQVIAIPGYGKYYTELTEADYKEAFETSKFDYEYTEETKEIAGYQCKKVNVKVTDLETDEEETVVVWVSNDLVVGDNINFSTMPGLKGFPLRTESVTDVQGSTFTYVETATVVKPSKKVKAADFYLPSDAVNFKDAPDDLKQQLGIE